MTTKTHRSTSVLTDDIIIVILAIISILITELISCFTQSPKKLPSPLATSPSRQKKVSNSTKPKSTTTASKANVQRTAVSIATNKASSGATGNLSTATKNSKDGTTCQPTRTSKSGRSTPSRSPRTKKKLNQTIPTAGLGFSV